MNACSNTKGLFSQALSLGLSSLRDATILEAIFQSLDHDEQQRTTCQSKFELATRTGLTPAAVQRGLTALRDAGFIYRSQLLKQKGYVAFTMITPKGLHALGQSSIYQVGDILPPLIADALLTQDGPVVDAVCLAYRECRMPTEEVATAFDGGPKRWAVIEQFLRGRCDEQLELELQGLKEEQKGMETSSHHLATNDAIIVPLADGNVRRIDAASFARVAPAQTDWRFVRETIVRLIERAAIRVDEESLPRLVGEIAYSRSLGFVKHHTWESGVRILAAVMSRPSWSKPKSISPAWYRAAASSLKRAA